MRGAGTAGPQPEENRIAKNKPGFWASVRAVTQGTSQHTRREDNPAVFRGGKHGARVTVYGAARGGPSRRR